MLTLVQAGVFCFGAVMSMEFANKLVAVLNEKIEVGVAMNALAHMTLGLASQFDKNQFHFTDFVDADGGSHPHISKMPFMILKANSSKIRALRHSLIAKNIPFVDFTDTMTKDTYVEQIARTKMTTDANLIYYGIVTFGDWTQVSELTRKFSLWK
jgi:hypothetical protein